MFGTSTCHRNEGQCVRLGLCHCVVWFIQMYHAFQVGYKGFSYRFWLIVLWKTKRVYATIRITWDHKRSIGKIFRSLCGKYLLWICIFFFFFANPKFRIALIYYIHKTDLDENQLLLSSISSMNVRTVDFFFLHSIVIILL